MTFIIGKMTTAFEDIEVSDWNKLRSTIQEEGFHLSQFNDEGMNLLHAACSNSNTPADIIEKMIQTQHGAIHSLSKSRSLPIHYACESGSATTVKLLLELNSKIGTFDVRFYTRYLDINERTCLDRCWLKYLFSKSTQFASKEQISIKLNGMNNINSAKDLHGDLLDLWDKTKLILFAASKNSTKFESMKDWNVLQAVARCGSYDTCWCPSIVMWLALKVNRGQIKWRDTDGNTILHIAASSATHMLLYVPSLITKSINHDMNRSVLEMLVTYYPDAVNIRNTKKELPLHLAIKSAKTLKDGIGALTKIYADAVNEADEKTGLRPFMLAAASPSREIFPHEISCQHHQFSRKEESLDLIYFLLQKNPMNAIPYPQLYRKRKRKQRQPICPIKKRSGSCQISTLRFN